MMTDSTRPLVVMALPQEGGALFERARLQGARFGCIKFVTDGAEDGAANAWQAMMGHAAERFLGLYRRLD